MPPCLLQVERLILEYSKHRKGEGYTTAPKNSTKESFVDKNPPRNIAELLDVAQVVGHAKKKVIRERDMIDLEADMPTKVLLDEADTMSLTLWNDEVQAIVDSMLGKFQLTNTTSKKLLPVFTVLRLSDDPEILDSIRVAVTPSKMDTEATSFALSNITSLDLESRTDENTTPVSTKKNNAIDHVHIEESLDGRKKRPAENDIRNESSNGKKHAIEHAVIDDKNDEYCYEMEVKEQKQWKLESDREARLEAARKEIEEHWKEHEAIRKLEEEYEEDPKLEEDDEDNEYESVDYEDLHLAYSANERPPMLERGNYIPWESRFRRFLDNKLDEREGMWNSIEKGPYKRPMIPNLDNAGKR
ncbi:hypothetical protein Tco_0861252 [Tanacetum coccineum]|uniref:Uncharacterized protein n=1 Tax=Tanacetum coccineum TaxID=301880 RepID=A0ABQ5BHD3_9ASTR